MPGHPATLLSYMDSFQVQSLPQDTAHMFVQFPLWKTSLLRPGPQNVLCPVKCFVGPLSWVPQDENDPSHSGFRGHWCPVLQLPLWLVGIRLWLCALCWPQLALAALWFQRSGSSYGQESANLSSSHSSKKESRTDTGGGCSAELRLPLHGPCRA